MAQDLPAGGIEAIRDFLRKAPAWTRDLHKLIDANLGVIQRGTWKVADAVNEQPWLPIGPIPLNVTFTAGVAS